MSCVFGKVHNGIYFGDFYFGAGGTGSGEFVEIALGPDDDPNDFIFSAYASDGTLHTGSGLPSGEVNLGTLSGTADPDNPNWTIYTIPLGFRNAVSDVDEASGIALTSLTDGLVSFYSGDASSTAPITATEGAADGNTSTKTISGSGTTQSVQWDYLGNQTQAEQTPNNAVVICFMKGTLIETKDGLRPIEDIAVDDLVLTKDNGYQPVRWVYYRKIPLSLAQRNRKLFPVLVRAGRLGNGLPRRDLRISRQHRVLIHSEHIRPLLDDDEALISAIQLTKLQGVRVDEKVEALEYYQFLFDNHEIIYSEGIETESLYTGPNALKALSIEAQEELVAIFPELTEGVALSPLARICPKGSVQKKILRAIKHCAQD